MANSKLNEARRKLARELAAVLERNQATIDTSRTYTTGVCFELNCGGVVLLTLPESLDGFGPKELTEIAENQPVGEDQ